MIPSNDLVGRLRRAREVQAEYQFSPSHMGGPGQSLWVQRGKSLYLVTYDVATGTLPECSCPDSAVQRLTGSTCKHALAVLLRDPAAKVLPNFGDLPSRK
mgnify:CR=1 FL=1